MSVSTRAARRAAVLALAAPALLAAGEARAATDVFVVDDQVRAIADIGRANNMFVFDQGTDLIVRDFGDTVAAGAGCSQVDPVTARCPRSGLFSVLLAPGDLDDTVTKLTDLPGTLIGDVGNDSLRAGPTSGRDNDLIGGPGNDTLTGGPDEDRLDGGSGADAMTGGPGRDLATYERRLNLVRVTLDSAANDGETGEGDLVSADVEDVIGGRGNDTLVGTGADNTLTGGRGNDALHGMGGGDTLVGAEGDDTQYGYEGDDQFLGYRRVRDPDGADTVYGGLGVDHMSYAHRTQSLVVTMDGVAGDGASGEGDNVGADVERLTGGRVSDTLVGNSWNNTIDGGIGNDLLAGLFGSDTLNGFSGTDRLSAGPGDDVLDGGSGADWLHGDVGRDRVEYDTRTTPLTVTIDNLPDDGQALEGDNVTPSVEDVTGGTNDDTLTGSKFGNHLIGGAGADTLNGLDGDDRLTGDSGADTLLGGAGNDLLEGIDLVGGNDALDGEADVDTCQSDAGDSETGCEA